MSVSLEEALASVEKGELAPVYLVWGEEFLAREGANELVKRLLPDASSGLNLAVMDGASPKELAVELATMPLFPGRKLVLIREPEFLAPKKGRGDALSKAREAWKAGRRREAAKRVLALAARAGWTAAQLDPSAPKAPSVAKWSDELGVTLAEADVAFLKEISAFCKDEKLTSPEGDDAALLSVLEKGLPPGHVLVVAATEVDSKSALALFAKKRGVVVERKVASKLKDLDLSEVVASVLGPLGKRLAPKAEALLKERCGGNMRLLHSELEKLALYVDGALIQEADVALLVAYAREEEYLELSEALQGRNLRGASDYLREALAQGAASLQLLGAITSIVRTLLMNFERARLLSGGRPPTSFPDFQKRIFPQVEAEARAAGTKVPHPYAAFMGMQAAGRFTRGELLGALAACAEADLALKSGGGKLVLERLIWAVCAKVPLAAAG